MSLGGMRPSGASFPQAAALFVSCERCGVESGPFGEAPEACPECGASDEHLIGEIRWAGAR